MLTNCLLAVTLLLFQQVPRQRTPRQQQSPNLQGSNTDAVATFSGTFKSADKKFLLIEVEGGNTMQMYITSSTKFIRNDKPAKASDFQPGESVTVDASRDARLNLLAVRIAPVPAAKAPEK